MNTNEHELIFTEEVFDAVGCAMEVLKELGQSLLEKPSISVHSCSFVVLSSVDGYRMAFFLG